MTHILPKALAHLIGRPFLWTLLIVALTILCMAGCDSCLGKGPAPGTPGVQSPTAPQSAPLKQTPDSPVMAPSTPRPGFDDATSAEDSTTTQETSEQPTAYNADTIFNIKAGMSYEEVKKILGDPGVIIAGTDQENSVYRWSSEGLSFMGRFENGKLIRKTTIAAEYGEGVMDRETLQFDQELFDMIQPGMSFDEVLRIIGMDAQPLSSGNTPVKLYKWTDANGSSITARFENQVLKRKSGMIIAPDTERKPDTADDSETDKMADADLSAKPVRDSVDDYPPLTEDTTQPPEQTQETTKMAPQKPRVHVVGAKRREREIAEDPSPYAGRSYRPKVKLPEFKRRLRTGSYEIRVHNTTQSRARIAIISDEGGLELSVGPNSHTATRVNRGTYQFYFIYDDAPYTLHQGHTIPVEEYLMDFAIYLFDDSSKVDFL